MGEVQIWQYEGLGTGRETLERVLRIFRSDGVQGIKSQQALAEYLKKVDESGLRFLFETDEEAAMQILTDCFGVKKALEKFIATIGNKGKGRPGWISPEAYAEVTKKYEDRIKRAYEEKERIFSDYTNAEKKAENAEAEIMRMQKELIRCKADLYDLYVQVGKLPGYERRERK